MNVAVATANNQYVFRRNYSTRKWESLSGSGKTCRIQVMKKSATDYTLRIFPEDGEVRGCAVRLLPSLANVNASLICAGGDIFTSTSIFSPLYT